MHFFLFAENQFEACKRVPRFVRSVQQLRVGIVRLAAAFLEPVAQFRVAVALNAVRDRQPAVVGVFLRAVGTHFAHFGKRPAESTEYKIDTELPRVELGTGFVRVATSWVVLGHKPALAQRAFSTPT